MSTTIRDWSAWPFTIAGWEFDQLGRATAWKVLGPGTAGSLEETQAYEGWLAAPPATNEEAFASGRPLPFPDQATPLQLRPYDRKRWRHGQLLTDRRDAAIFAPGDFPDVDTSYDPPRFYPPVREVKTPPRAVEASTATTYNPPAPDDTTASSTNRAVNVPAGVFAAPPRAAAIGEQVVVHLGDGTYDAAEIMGLAHSAYGTVADVAYVRTGQHGYRWAPIVAWVDPA